MKFAIVLILCLQSIPLYLATVGNADDIQQNNSTSNKSFFDLLSNNATRFLPGELHDPNSFSTGYTNLSRDDIIEVVRQHNMYRANTNPPAADMKEMSWNSELATMSQNWADKCTYQYGGLEPNLSPYKSVGQNFYVRYGRGRESAVLATNLWHGENEYFSFDNETCDDGEVCCHYTKVVGSDTSAIGCGRKLCSQIDIGSGRIWKNVYLIVCNYGPVGVGVLPFTKGDRCSKCPADAAYCTSDGLCRDCRNQTNEFEQCGVCNLQCQNCGTLDTDTCTCQCAPGWDGADCSEPCENHHRWCGAIPGWPRAAFCDIEPYARLVKHYCRKMCGSCQPPSTDFQCTNTTEPPRTVKSTKYCKTIFNSVTVINQQLYAFKKGKYWRFDSVKNGRLLTSASGDDVTKHFKKINPYVTAVYQRATDGKVLCFRGRNYWQYTEDVANDRWLREEGFPKPIAEDLKGLSQSTSTALYDNLIDKTYLFKGSYVCRYDERGHRFDMAQTRIETVFHGIPSKLTGAFQDDNGDFIFVKGRDFWRVRSGENRVVSTEPENLALNFMDCYE